MRGSGIVIRSVYFFETTKWLAAFVLAPVRCLTRAESICLFSLLILFASSDE